MSNKMLHQAESLCPVCMARIPARYVTEDNRVFLTKECAEHGRWKTLVWSNAEQYEKWSEQSVHAEMKETGSPMQSGCPFDCGLCEQHECGSCTVVLELTYKCNMHCPLCFADAKELDYHPDIATIERMLDAIKKQSGDCSIQMSGGEPTLREDLPDIIRMAREKGFSHIQVNTNGIRISENIEYLRELKNAGAALIYLQFDGTNDDIYRYLRGRDMWEIKQKAIANCEEVGIGVMLVPVIMSGVNMDEIGNIIAYAKAHMPVVKGVHFQPASFFGRYPEEDALTTNRANLSDVVRELELQTNGEIKEEHIIPRKPFDGHCSFSAQYFLGEDGVLNAISNFEKNNYKFDITNFPGITNRFTNKNWRMSESCGLDSVKPERKIEGLAEGRTAKFIKRLKEYTLSISGMGFQDVWNIDVGRLKGCCVHICSTDGKLIPLCAFHVSSIDGKRLYSNV